MSNKEKIDYLEKYVESASYSDSYEVRNTEIPTAKYRMKELILEKFGLNKNKYDLYNSISTKKISNHIYKNAEKKVMMKHAPKNSKEKKVKQNLSKNKMLKL